MVLLGPRLNYDEQNWVCVSLCMPLLHMSKGVYTYVHELTKYDCLVALLAKLIQSTSACI